MKMKGYIHSFESMGGADGPGIRFVVFMQGCPLRCAYCHNPDTWAFCGGTEYSAEEVARRVLRMKPYFGDTGGVTLSGGEVLMQADFAAELFEILHGQGIHTALDTSGAAIRGDAERLLSLTDLVICDIKFPSDSQYEEYCGIENGFSRVREFLALTETAHVPLWVRHVVIPGITDNDATARDVVRAAREYSNLRKIEFLPFRKLCAEKYERMNIRFPFADIPECPPETIEQMYRAEMR